jgi:pimeloyl-ACP methyl ester carboxylesterase
VIRRTARLSPAELRLACAAPRPAAGFTSRLVEAGGLRLHVRHRGEPGPAGPSWVLLHGLAVSHRYLMPTAAALAGPAVCVPDLPGFGLSDKPQTVYDTVRHAAAVAAWLDAEGIAGAYVLGNSFGCQVAVELAVRRPELVSALVLVGPTVDPAAPSAWGQVRRWLGDLTREDPRQARILAADLRDAGPRRVLGTLRHSVRHHIERRLPLVGAPALVLRGEHDPIAPTGWVVKAAGLLPDGRAGVVRRAAHNAVTTEGGSVAAQANAFVAAHGRRPSPASPVPAGEQGDGQQQLGDVAAVVHQPGGGPDGGDVDARPEG